MSGSVFEKYRLGRARRHCVRTIRGLLRMSPTFAVAFIRSVLDGTSALAEGAL